MPLIIIQKEFDKHKAKLLSDLGFTPKQQAVVELMQLIFERGIQKIYSTIPLL